MKGRGPVVRLDRSKKAQMINAILADYLKEPVQNRRTLDIGCGNGGISEFFAAHNDHYGVDIIDQRHDKEANYHFKQVDSECLPFEDNFFDIVLSHHVIEHVASQDLHLCEIARVLKPTGIAYLATPNKSSPIMEGHVGNEKVLRYKQMQPLFEKNGFDSVEYGLAVVGEPRRFHCEVQYGQYLPTPLLRLLRPVYPSHMFVLLPR